MKLYNTLTRSVEGFIPITASHSGIYTCGPTVYDYAHIGHWFNYVRMDMLVRTLKASGYTVKWIMNITDVGHLTSDADEGEDKLQQKAKKEGKSAWEIAEFFIKDFNHGLKLMNISTPDVFPRATEHIEEQIRLIKVLESKNYTYVIEGDGVYYDTSKFPKYSYFARLDLDEQQAGARVSLNKNKRQPWDFALWKFTPAGVKRDMEWDSPWGKGFPGWHIECSAMALKYLGETIDIHSGGIDHVPVHHTNEIAQSEAATGKRLANYWLHSNHVLIDEQKISKSLGNSITIDDCVKKGYSPEVLRLHILESHYRNQSRFSWKSLESAKNRLKDLAAMAVLRYQAKEVVHDAATFSLGDIPEEIKRILQNDLNTPEALSFLSNASTQLTSVNIESDMVDHYSTMLEGVDNILGLKLSKLPDISEETKQLIKKREIARIDGDYGESDRIRQILEQNNIGINDTKDGPIWYYLDAFGQQSVLL